jgi:uncharacterized protein YciI
MAFFAVHYTYSPSTIDGRDTHRATHRAWLADLLEQKILVSSGPYTDIESVKALFAQDPFAVENLIDASAVTEWKPVMGAFA